MPRAVVGSAIVIGLFYVLCSYAWVFGAGFDGFVDQATGADPWRNLGKVFWGTGWILVFLAICNSIAANSNAAVNAATRVFYSLARNGLAPRSWRTRIRNSRPRTSRSSGCRCSPSRWRCHRRRLGPAHGFSLVATAPCRS